MWPDRRLLDLFKIDLPIVQAPMAGAMDHELAIAAARAGALGALPCAMLSPDKARDEVNIFRQQVSAPVSMNFFAHTPVAPDPARVAAWRERLAPYYREHGLDPAMALPAATLSAVSGRNPRFSIALASRFRKGASSSTRRRLRSGPRSGMSVSAMGIPCLRD